MTGPELTRRTLLRAGAVAAGASAIVLEAPAAHAAQVAPQPALRGPLRLDDFRPQVGTAFSVRDGSGRARVLRLVEARATPVVSSVPGFGEAFALDFRGGRGARMPSATYELRHPTMGTFELFLHPVGSGRGYEAVVNRWRPVVPAPVPARLT